MQPPPELDFKNEKEREIVRAMARAMCVANGDDPYEDPDNASGSILHWRAYFEHQALLQYRAWVAMNKCIRSIEKAEGR